MAWIYLEGDPDMTVSGESVPARRDHFGSLEDDASIRIR
jgi:hypothetical protein